MCSGRVWYEEEKENSVIVQRVLSICSAPGTAPRPMGERAAQEHRRLKDFFKRGRHRQVSHLGYWKETEKRLQGPGQGNDRWRDMQRVCKESVDEERRKAPVW